MCVFLYPAGELHRPPFVERHATAQLPAFLLISQSYARATSFVSLWEFARIPPPQETSVAAAAAPLVPFYHLVPRLSGSLFHLILYIYKMKKRKEKVELTHKYMCVS